MAATVQIIQLCGASQQAPGTANAAIDKTSTTIRFGRLDDPDVADQTPIPVPPSGQSYSMRVTLRPYISSASGSFTSITSPVWYNSTGANPFGTFRKLWYQMGNGGTYTTPAIPSEAQDPPQISGPMSDWFGTNSGAPADGDALINPGATAINSTSPAAPKYFGDFLHLVFEVEATSPQGLTPSAQITFAWSEV